MAGPPLLKIDSLSAFRFPPPAECPSSSDSTITSLSVSPQSPTHQSRHQLRPKLQDRQSQSHEQSHIQYPGSSETQPLLQTRHNHTLYYLNITSNSVPTPVLPFLLSPFTPHPDSTQYPSLPPSSSSGSSTRTEIPFYSRSYSEILPERGRGRESYCSDLEGGSDLDGDTEGDDGDREEDCLRRAERWCTIFTLFLSVLGFLIMLGRWWFYA